MSLSLFSLSLNPFCIFGLCGCGVVVLLCAAGWPCSAGALPAEGPPHGFLLHATSCSYTVVDHDDLDRRRHDSNLGLRK